MPRIKHKFQYRLDRFHLLSRRQQLIWFNNGPRAYFGEPPPDYVERLSLMDAKLTPEGAKVLAAIFRAAYEAVTADD